jgi:murein tripeptide amidase MpaA
MLRLAAAGAVTGALTAPLAAQSIDFTKYHTHAELTSALERLVAAHGDLARLVPVATTRGDRTVWAIEIANPAGPPVDQRPALLIAANLEGDQLIGSELALFTAEWLLGQYASNADVKQRIDEHAFYILPRVNPDGAEAMFAQVKQDRSRNLAPYDDDNDGRTDEDAPDDLNGDGVIAVMRVRDPRGAWMIHPDDPRLLRRADAAKGESGGWALYIEGRDDDGDGFYNEDGQGGVDLNRNFQHQYPYYAPDAGRHMVSEAETRGLLEYVIARRNIAAILTFGASDNLVAPPDSRGELTAAAPLSLPAWAAASNDDARTVGLFGGGGRGGRGGRGGAGAGGAGGAGGGGGRGPAVTVNAADLEYLREVSDQYRELTGVENTGATRRPEGAFFQYGYFQFGVPSFTTPGWGPAPPENGGSSDTDLRILRWLDAQDIDGFIEWTPFEHPQLGAVDIGGFRPYATSNPPATHIAELGAGHAQFVLYLSSLFPRVRIAHTEVTDHGGGVFRIRAEIENTGYLPTALAQGVTADAVRPVMVQLGVAPEDILTGDVKTNFIDALAGSGTRRAFQWVVRGQPGANIELKLASQKSGNDSVTLTLRGSRDER